jgi:GTP-binding protein
LQAHVTNLDASPFLGRLALLRVFNGTIKKGQTVAWVKHDGSVANVRVTELLTTRALDRYPTDSATAGDIVAVAGFDDITIGETLADPDDVRPLPTIKVDDPAISMTIGTNTSPLIGKVKGHKLTARMVKDRLDRELVGNVSIKLVDIGRPDAWEVQGRGELALAILVEQMRREGYELTVGKPQVVTRSIDGKLHEPFEHLTIDVPEEYLGAVTQLLAARKGRMDGMTNHGTGWVRMEFIVPSRGLIGFRTEFLTITRGTGIANAISHGYEPWAGQIVTRVNGSIVADRAGAATPFAMVALQERMTFFVEPTQEVYEGMVVGENSRAEDMDVNITKEKQLTNMRQSTSDTFERMTPSRKLTLEECLEFAREDECVEVTPEVIRIRKVELDANARARAASRSKKQDA